MKLSFFSLSFDLNMRNKEKNGTRNRNIGMRANLYFLTFSSKLDNTRARGDNIRRIIRYDVFTRISIIIFPSILFFHFLNMMLFCDYLNISKNIKYNMGMFLYLQFQIQVSL